MVLRADACRLFFYSDILCIDKKQKNFFRPETKEKKGHSRLRMSLLVSKREQN